MKRDIFLYAIILVLSVFSFGLLTAQRIGINTATPDPSAMLDIKASDKGLLTPRTSTASRTGIANPAKGLMVYDTTTSSFWYHNGSAWNEITGGGANKTLSNLTSPTAVNTNLLPDANTRNLGADPTSWNNLYLVGSVYVDGYRFLANGNGTDYTNTAVGSDANLSNTDGGFNTATGYDAMYYNTTGSYNTANGAHALFSNTTGAGNTAIGESALRANTTGFANTAVGSDALLFNSGGLFNTAIGVASLHENSTGIGNTANGWYSLYANSTGSGNTATGRFALSSNTTGYSNVAIGIAALKNSTTGRNLVAVGDSALFTQTTGNVGYQLNTAIGSKTLYSNTTGYQNTATGNLALYANTTGSYNTAHGSSALSNNTTGIENTANGSSALGANTTGSSNVADGTFALFSNTTGNYNTADGGGSLSQNTTGSYNTANGSLALRSNTNGHSNTAVGISALFFNTSADNLVAVGDSALYNNGTGAASSIDATANVAVGSKALYTNTIGRANTGFGFQSLYANTTGNHNTGVGYFAGNNVISGSDNTFLGYDANSGVAGTVANSTAIGSGATVTASNNFVFGNASVVKWGFGQVAAAGNIIDFVNTTARLTTGGVWTNASDRRLKDRFEQLDKAEILDKILKLDIERWHYIKDGPTNITHIGPVAQDFYQAFKVGDDTTISTIDPGGIALLGIQELIAISAEKDVKIDLLKKEATDLKQQVAMMQRQLENKEEALAKRVQQLETLVLKQNSHAADMAKK